MIRLDSENHPQSPLALSITKATMVAPRSLPRPSGLPGRNGIAFEHKLARAIASDLSIPYRDFTQDLCHFNPTIESSLPQVFPQVIKTSHFYHNPWFKYRIFGQNSLKFCAPDFLVFLQKPECEVFSENNPEKHLWDFASAKFFQNQNQKNTSNHFENQNNFEILKPDSKEPQDSKISDIDFKNQNATIIIIVEVKLTYTDSAWVKLQNLYIPIIKCVYPNAMILPLIIVKNQIQNSPQAGFTILESLKLPIPLLQWLGHSRLQW